MEESEAVRVDPGETPVYLPSAPRTASPEASPPIELGSPRVVVLAGGLSHERDVSVRSGRRVAEELRAVGVEVTVHDLDSDLFPLLEQIRPDLVWPLLHGSTGEDGSIRDLLELAGVRYVGTDPRGSRLAWDKPIAKTVVARAGIETPDFVALPHSLFREIGAKRVMAALVHRLGVPLVVKPARGGSALGVSLVTSPEDLPRAMVECFSYGDVALVERAVLGTEVAVSIVDAGDGPRALPAVEIVTDGSYDYDARYNAGRTEYFAPARLDAEVAAAVARTALEVHTLLGLRHLSRTDLIVDDAGTPHFLEVNVAPGMTELSLLPQAVLAEGTELGPLYRAIAENALRG